MSKRLIIRSSSIRSSFILVILVLVASAFISQSAQAGWPRLAQFFRNLSGASEEMEALTLPLQAGAPRACLDALTGNRYRITKKRMKICALAAAPAGIEALSLVTAKGGEISDDNLQALLQINHPMAVRCIQTLVSGNVGIGKKKSINKIEACANARHETGVLALRELLRLRWNIRNESIIQALRIKSPLGVSCLKLLIDKNYSVLKEEDLVPEIFNQTTVSRAIVRVCSQAKYAEGMVALKKVATAQRIQLSYKTIAHSLQIGNDLGAQCIDVFLSRGTPLGNPEYSFILEFCSRLRLREQLAALKSLVLLPKVRVSRSLLGALLAEQSLAQHELEAQEKGEDPGGSAEFTGVLPREEWAIRSPVSSDLFIYSEILRDLALQKRRSIVSIRDEIERQILFHEELLFEREYLLEKAGVEELRLYTSQVNSLNGAFHAELCLENKPWETNVSQNSVQMIPLVNRLNYIHNALKSAYLQAKITDRVTQFFERAFDIADYCIDARTETLVSYVKSENSRFDPGLGCKNLESFYLKLIHDHMAELQNKGAEVTPDAIREMLLKQVGKLVFGKFLTQDFADRGVELAESWGIFFKE